MRGKQPTEILVGVDSLTEDGLGNAIYAERPYKIRNALPGEQVQARILKKRKGLRYADAVDVVAEAHPQRVSPACPYFPRCGGCSLHHLDYAAGLELKQQHLLNELHQAEVSAQRVHAPVSVGRLGYRRKARLGVKKVGGEVLVGFRESFSNRVSKSDSCQTLTEEISTLISPLKRLLTQLSIGDKIPQIEVAQGDRGLVLIIRHLAEFSALDVTSLRAFSEQRAFTMLLQAGGPDTVMTLDGGDVPLLDYALPEFGLHYQFDPRQFTQVNAAMNQVLVGHAMTYLRPQVGERIVDLFCGIGNFSLPIARLGALVTGYELDATAIARAELNAQRNNLAERSAFYTQDLYRDPPAQIAQGGAHGILLDPPRSGAGAQLQHWIASPTVQRVVYVSCNPISFAQDAQVLAAHGLQLVDVGVYDMFPNTSHVETLGYFERPQHG